MAPCHVCDSPRLEPVHAATRPLGPVSSDEFRFLDWNRLDPVSGVAGPLSQLQEARRRA